MNEAKNKAMKPEEELVEVLLDFIIVSANLVKNICSVMRGRQSTEGGKGNVKNERAGYCGQRSSQCRSNH